MNWSITTCAPLTKSPNCASQITSVFGSARGVAVLEAEHRLFGQQRVDDDERRLVRRRRAAAACRCRRPTSRGSGRAAPRGGGVKVPRAAVLARQAHGIAAGHQRRIGQVLAHAPVDVDLAAAHRGAVVQHLLDQRVQLEVRRARSSRARPGACISASGSAVSAASVHLRLRNGAQSTAYLLLKLVSTGSAVCLPASIAARKSP